MKEFTIIFFVCCSSHAEGWDHVSDSEPKGGVEDGTLALRYQVGIRVYHKFLAILREFTHNHGLSQLGSWVSFWTPKPLESTPQDTQIFLRGIS